MMSARTEDGVKKARMDPDRPTGPECESGTKKIEQQHTVTDSDPETTASSTTGRRDTIRTSDADGSDFKDFKFSARPSLEEIRQLQSEFCRERNWDQYHQPRNLMLALVGEVGELAEIFQWRGEVQEGLPGWSEKDKKHVGQELSDCLIYLTRLAEKCHIDLPAEVLNKMELNRLKYPASQVYGSSKKYTEYKAD